MRIEQHKNKQFEQHLSEGKKMAELGLQCRSVALLALCVFLSIITVPAVEARTRYYKWEVKYEYRSPDCYKKLAITINGITPGPTILAQQGDTIVVELKNGLLTENTVVHWHGIRQIGTPWSDGTEGVTQCPIAPGETFRYQFVVDRPGTYMYHSHYGMQRELGLYGSIQVSLPDGVLEPFAYDYDQSIILADWYHKSPNDLATGLSSIPFVWVGDPQALLIQGRGRFNCSGLSSDVCNATNPECSPHVLTVIPGKTYRLRIASLTSLSVLSIEIEGHNMTVVEADGHNVDPLVLKNLYINSGETYSVLIKADQDPSRNYWLTTNVVDRESTTPTGLAIFNYKPNDPQKSPPTVPTEGPFWNDRASRLSQSMAVKAHKDFIDPPPRTPDRVIQLLNTINQIDGRYRWALNNISLTLPQTPYLVALKDRLLNAFDQTPPPDVYDLSYDIYSSPDNINTTSGDAIYRLGFNTTVDIILQNANSLGPNLSDTHPWHLHGHDFWVLGYGEGKFNLSTDTNKYNLVNPIKRNTVVLHPYAWTALRFRADNPGVWSFHCHVEPHLYLGMMVVFEEGVEKVGKLPSSVRGCGKTKGLGRP